MRLKSTQGHRTAGFFCAEHSICQKMIREATIVSRFTALFSLETILPLIHCCHTASSCCLSSSPSRSCRRSLNTQLWQTATGKYRYHNKTNSKAAKLLWEWTGGSVIYWLFFTCEDAHSHASSFGPQQVSCLNKVFAGNVIIHDEKWLKLEASHNNTKRFIKCKKESTCSCSLVTSHQCLIRRHFAF